MRIQDFEDVFALRHSLHIDFDGAQPVNRRVEAWHCQFEGVAKSQPHRVKFVFHARRDGLPRSPPCGHKVKASSIRASSTLPQPPRADFDRGFLLLHRQQIVQCESLGRVLH